MSLTEYFEKREDFLNYRHAIFGKRLKKFGPQAAYQRPIVVCSILCLFLSLFVSTRELFGTLL